MKATAVIVILFLSQLFSAWKPVQEIIQFRQATIEQALDESSCERKLVFLEFYASHCAVCKQMKRRVHSDQALGEFFNANFINIRIDTDTEEGNELAKKYHVVYIPTLLFLESNGKPYAGLQGYQKAPALLAAGQDIAASYSGMKLTEAK
jgi:thiol:disulfide interchange protein